MDRVRVKICGITNLQDAITAVDCGADALGFIFTKSPRQVSSEVAREIISSLPPFICSVGVFMNQSFAEVEEISQKTAVSMIQLHGDESPEFCRKFSIPVMKRLNIQPGDTAAVIQQSIRDYPHTAYLIDPGKGSGKAFDWTILQGFDSARLVIAGSIGPHNVKEAITTCRPYGIDVCSGVEAAPGIKDPEKILKLMEEII